MNRLSVQSPAAVSSATIGADEATHVAPTQPDPSISPPVELRAASSSLASLVPPGGLHPVAHEPGTALFGVITQALHDAMNKSGVFGSIGDGVAPAAKAAGKTLGESLNAH
ncbi:MAG TPA: hypothetical protein VLW55_01060 [Burkholderiaceae bacterium]|nr:hypothetical protein [Burkholderiaceae bacterium]